MKLVTLRDAYDDATSKTSDLVRNLGFAGIGIVWVFKEGVEGDYSVPSGLFGPAIFLVLTLTLDLIHYIVRSATWGIYHRHKEKLIDEDVDFRAPSWINIPSNIVFVLKIVSAVLAYSWLLVWFCSQY